MQGRYLVPKNFGFYAIFLLAALAGWLGIFWLYGAEPEIAKRLGVESLACLDPNQTGSFFQWFASLIWILIAVHSFMMIFFVISRSRRELYESWMRESQGVDGMIPKYNGFIKVLFWMNGFFIAFLMSADSICHFSHYFLGGVREKFTELTKADSGISLFSFLLVGAACAVVYLIVRSLRKYVNSVRRSRFTLYFFFFVTSVLLGLTILCHCLIPDPALLKEEERAKLAKTRIVPIVSDPNQDSSDNAEGTTEEKNGRKQSRFLGRLFPNWPSENELSSGESGTGEGNDKGSSGKTSESKKEKEKGKKKEKSKYLLVSHEKPIPDPEGEEGMEDREQVAGTTGIETDGETVSEEDQDLGSSRIFRSAADESSEDDPDDEEESDEDSYGTYEGESELSSGDSPKDCGVTWEMIFGWDKTIEESLHLKRPFEEYFALSDSSENLLLGKFPPLDLVQLRTLFRKGFYGLFLIFLSTSLGFLSRAERLVFERKLKVQQRFFRNPFSRLKRGYWDSDDLPDRYSDRYYD